MNINQHRANNYIKSDRQGLAGGFRSNGFDENRSNLTFIVTSLPAAYAGVRFQKLYIHFSCLIVNCGTIERWDHN